MQKSVLEKLEKIPGFFFLFVLFYFIFLVFAGFMNKSLLLPPICLKIFKYLLFI